MKTPVLAGPVLRVGVALLLCAACFQAGRWYQELSSAGAPRRGTAKGDPGTEMVTATFRGDPEPGPKNLETKPPTSAPGDPVGQSGDIITPLNVRDPSALVMGPGASINPPEGVVPEPTPPSVIEPPPAPRAKPSKPLKSGRLLELLKKADKKSAAPKSF